jgi:hypothetical protein
VTKEERDRKNKGTMKEQLSQKIIIKQDIHRDAQMAILHQRKPVNDQTAPKPDEKVAENK